MKNNQEIKRLLEKHLNRDLSGSEANELFDHLRIVHRPEDLEAYFQSRWNIDRTSDIDPDITWEKILQENKRRSVKRNAMQKRVRGRKLWQLGVAASVLLLVSVVWWNWDTSLRFTTYKTGFGETKNIVLDDGTSVILNANSELIWISNWKDDNVRSVQLRGEAFFKVAHIEQETELFTKSSDPAKSMPFQVKTSDMVIDVMGTSFNVAERRGETQVYLEEGSVQLGLLDKDDPQNITENNANYERVEEQHKPLKTVLMQPGESIGYSAETKELQKDDSQQSKALTEWKEGTLVYENVLFGDMLNHMEDIYGKEFVVQDGEILRKYVSFGVPYENWEIVQKLMERTLGVDIVPVANNKTKIIKRK